MRTTEYIMGFRCLREEFLTALDAVRGFTSSSKNEPALQAVKVEIKNDSVTFSATDGDVYALFTMTPGDTRGYLRVGLRGLRVGLRGAATLPAKEVRELVRATKDHDVELYTSEGALTVESRSYKAPFKQGADAAAFPAPPKIKEDAAMATISGKDLQRLIKNTAYAAGKRDAFYNVTSILFEYSKNGIKAVATDGYRLAIDKAPLSESKGLEGRKTLISGKALDNLRRAIPKDEDVEILLDDEYVQFKAGRFTLIAPCGTEGKQFPDYQTIYPNLDGWQSEQFDAGKLRDALDHVKAVAKKGYSGARFTFSDNGVVTVSPRCIKFGEDEIELSSGSANKSSTLYLDEGHLSSYLKGVRRYETVTMYFSETDYRTIFKAEGRGDFAVLQLRF